jgi:hypothetical protein
MASIISGASLIFFAYVLDRAPAPVRKTLAGIGLFELAAGLMSRTESATRRRPSGSYQQVPGSEPEPGRHAPPVAGRAAADVLAASH